MIPVLRRRDMLNPLDGFGQIFDEFSKRFDEVSHSFGYPTIKSIGKPSFIPSLDATETEKDYVIAVEAPGVKKEDIDVSVSDNERLVIKGKKESETIEGEDKYVQERYFGAFHREITLPDNINVSGIAVSFKDGVLTVVLPKTVKEKPEVRQLEVN